MNVSIARRALSGLLVLLFAAAAAADSFTMHITVDNQYAIYLGTATSTTGSAIGSDNDWTDVETYAGTIDPTTDFLYVPTASDHSVLQGFLAQFRNDTQNLSITTGSAAWDVFAAGPHLQAIDPSWPATWPRSQMPTQSEVDQAIAYATANSLWGAPSLGPGYTNVASGNPWNRQFPLIPAHANFIWHDTGGDSHPQAPFHGFNHDEFLIFRVAPVPEPTAGLLTMAGLVWLGLMRRSSAA